MMAVTGIERPQFATARDLRVTAISCSPIANVAPKATFVPARKDIRLKRGKVWSGLYKFENLGWMM